MWGNLSAPPNFAWLSCHTFRIEVIDFAVRMVATCINDCIAIGFVKEPYPYDILVRKLNFGIPWMGENQPKEQ